MSVAISTAEQKSSTAGTSNGQRRRNVMVTVRVPYSIAPVLQVILSIPFSYDLGFRRNDLH